MIIWSRVLTFAFAPPAELDPVAAAAAAALLSPRGLLPPADCLDLSPPAPNNHSFSLPPLSPAPGDPAGALRFFPSRLLLLLLLLLAFGVLAAASDVPLPLGNSSRFVMLTCASCCSSVPAVVEDREGWRGKHVFRKSGWVGELLVLALVSCCICCMYHRKHNRRFSTAVTTRRNCVPHLLKKRSLVSWLDA